MSEAGLPERPARRNLTERECSTYLNQIQASLRTMQLPLEFGDGTENTFLSVQVSMTISTARQEAWAFTYRINQPIIIEQVVAPIPPPIPPPLPPTISPSNPAPMGPRSCYPFDCGICCTDILFTYQKVKCGRCLQLICRSCAKQLTSPKCPFCRFRNWDWPEKEDEPDLAEISD